MFTRLFVGCANGVVVKKTKYVRLHEMDLTSGSREFWDVDDDVEDEAHYKSMTFGQKCVYHLKNW